MSIKKNLNRLKLITIRMLPVFLLGVSAPALTVSAVTAVSEAAADSTGAPAEVQLTSISSDAYNRITISWKKAAGATSYRIYRKAAGASKWSRIAVVNAGQLKYTHIASGSFPIAVGRDYTYTVRACSSKSGMLGAYDRKGLTIHTLPNKVVLKGAVWNSEGASVTVTWKEAKGGTYYRIYRRTSSAPKWKCIGTTLAGRLSFIDRTPVQGEKNFYTVRAGNKKAGVAGGFSGTQIRAVTMDEAELAETARLLKKSQTGGKTSQIILVVDHNLSFWEKSKSGDWTRKLSVYCGYGSNGLNADRHEGDRTTPIGSFPILHGFGIADNPGSTLKYRKITSYSYWSGEYSTYNQWVESARPVAGEHLISYYQYKYAMAIGFNRNPVVYKKGSAIFLHCKSYDHWSTAGCVSVEESVMKRLLQMSRNGVYMIIVRQRGDIASY